MPKIRAVAKRRGPNLQVDVLSAFVICGASSLVGAAILRLADASGAAVRRALDACTLGLLLVGLSLTGLLLLGSEPGAVGRGLIVFGSMSSLVCFIPAMALLASEKPLPTGVLAALMALAVVVAVAGPLIGGATLSLAFTLGMALSSSLMSYGARRFILRPRDHAERALGLSVAAMTASIWVRVGFAVARPGDPPPHLLQVPDWLLSPYAIFYGVLPVLAAALVLNLVNSRLQHDLNLRATTDALTGALTRRAWHELAPLALARYRGAGRNVALLMLDLDRFKAINDDHGHAAGDLVLKDAAALLRAQIRPDALLARYGGEEFVALIAIDDLRGARQAAERLRESIAGAEWHTPTGHPMTVTLSLGVTLVSEDESLEHALVRADEALYRAKNEGRNQVQVGLSAA